MRKIFAKAPGPNGYLFWERSRWKFNNKDGDQDSAYDELSDLLEEIVRSHFDNYLADLVVRMHDNNGDIYDLYCEVDDGGYNTAAWDWLEAQDEMYLDWVALFNDLVEEVHHIIMDDGGDICEEEK